MEEVTERHGQLDSSLAILIRERVASDDGFILKSFSRSFADNPYVRKLHLGEWIAGGSAWEILKPRLPAMKCDVACNPEDRDQIFGFILYEQRRRETVIHFLYTKEYLRKLNIGRRLLKSVECNLPISFSYPHPISKAWGFRHNAKFNPFHFFGIFIEERAQ